ncbi:MAG: bifunctional phosphoribosylaminoimidazolecarboxamide formyltransferase/IMP cyclohydrolase [Phycisphaerales bacterium]|nr:bifunctional phosphoribosylaminoimidazolecarboxamide formyltransferase/IMP cyclohydrolase [Phycisphaerales bacterium]
MSLVHVKRALLSVSDKTDLIPFARALSELGVELISTGGTAKALEAAGISVTPIHEITGFPEMMDGRVKTLHPRVHGALLGRPDLTEHAEAMDAHDIKPIQLVCINLYPFEQTIRRAEVTSAEAIEQIDIGGPSMLRSAAKNHDFVATVTTPAQYDQVVTELQQNDGATSQSLRRDLAAEAFARTASYDTAISTWMTSRSDSTFPPVLQLIGRQERVLRYGENPHQRAALYRIDSDDAIQLATAPMRNGKPLSYNNLNDAAAALLLVSDLAIVFPDRCTAAVIKHTNACGAAHGATPVEAFERAWAGDPRAAFGGIVASSSAIDATLATAITEGQKFLEVIIAPSFTDEAVAMLAERWANVRLLEVPGIGDVTPQSLMARTIPGGLLVQEPDAGLPDPARWTHAAGPAPDDALLDDARLLWVACKHLSSNAIAVGGDGMLCGAGTGQVDRVGACTLAIQRAGDLLNDRTRIIAASDAFFPFDDGPTILADAGVTCIVQPGGSKRDEDTVQLCNDRGITLLMTGVRHFRH